MIAEIAGKLLQKKDISLTVEVNGFAYEVLVPRSVLQRVDSHVDSEGGIRLKTYCYFQLSPSAGLPVLVGFLNDLERDFFLHFIKVSGIGPRAAVKALNQPISDIAGAIAQGDYKFLTQLPGIGGQKAREVIAKLQDKVGKYGLIQDHQVQVTKPSEQGLADWQTEALDVLLQLQYKKAEALHMIHKAVDRVKDLHTAEDLLNEIYKQRIQPS